MPPKAKASPVLPTIREELEASAQAIKDKLTQKSREGDLDILTFLQLVDGRISSTRIREAISMLPTGDKDSQFLHACLCKNQSTIEQLDSLVQSEVVNNSIKLALSLRIDRESFEPVKLEWKRLRKQFMVSVKLADTELHRHFVFLECVGRLLLIWHEEQSSENTRKNLKLIDHLVIKFDLVPLLKNHPAVIRLMNLLGEKYDNQNLKNRLKSEALNMDEAVGQEVSQPQPDKNETAEELQESPNKQRFAGLAANMDTAFLSENSDSSISSWVEDDKVKANKCKKEKVIGERFEVGFRDRIRERISERLKALVGRTRAEMASKNLEARLYCLHSSDPSLYDQAYSKLIVALDVLPTQPARLLYLVEHFFDLDVLLSQPEPPPTLGKRSLDKHTQTVPALPPLPPLPSLHEDEIIYLQQTVNQLRGENDLLRKSLYELRLSLTKCTHPSLSPK
jgi:hypothetical protein